MPFPEVKRVKYKKSPLENVICQLRFPPILKIDSEVPYLFQDKIREQFPNYEKKHEFEQEISGALEIDNATMSPIMNPMTSITTTTNHEFSSEDGAWKINLTRTFMSLSTTQYLTWEDMLNRLEQPFQALIQIYSPAFFSRLGLRYVDVFCRSVLKMEQCNWSELINPCFLGLLGSEIVDSVNQMDNIHEIFCEDQKSIIRIVTNLVRKTETNEPCFLMDSDVFTTVKISIDEMQDKLAYLHERSSRLVRYAITDKMHKALEPEEL